ncbi:MAG: amino acid--tRNA ligase-related protein, partial [bacterium]
MNKLKALIARRADLKSRTRQFFADRGVLEADVPALGEFGVTDVHIDCIPAKVNGSIRYLQSSPEYAMKRLLAEGSGAVYSLNYAYRDGEQGPRHRPEFLMLEWYRPGWDEHRLMDELAALCEALEIVSAPSEKLTYGEVFQSACGLNPHRAETGELQKIASDVSNSDFSAESRSTCLDLIF